MPLAQLKNTTLNYEIYGKGSKPLLLIGGLSTNHKTWNQLTKFLTPQFKLILPDNPGAGLSQQKFNSCNIATVANDIAELLEYLQIKQVVAVGHSMGGMILQELLLNHPNKIQKAIIAGASAKVPTHTVLSIRSIIELMETNTNVEIILNTVLPWLYADRFLADKEKITAEMHQVLNDPNPQTYTNYKLQAAAIENFDMKSQLNKITIPTLVISGEEDILIPKKISEQIYKSIPNAEFRVLDGCAHMLHREQPEMVAKLIIEFLKTKK